MKGGGVFFFWLFFLIVAAICFIFCGSNVLSVQFLTVLLTFLGS